MQTIRERLAEKGLKVTPQRVIILETVLRMQNHLSVEQIYEHIIQDHPNISLATVYKVLDVFVAKGLIQTVMTTNEIKMYDPVTESHHHIYHVDSNLIQDYFDDELNELLKNYFERKKFKDLDIEEIKVHIFGKTKKLKTKL